MTPEQVDIIRKSFDAMWSMRGDIADLCYSRFFELAPDAKDLFRSDMERQRIKLMDMIAALVGSLDQRALFQSLATQSGRQHARFGVRPSHYDALGEALMWSLERKFGASFTPELRASWGRSTLRCRSRCYVRGPNVACNQLPRWRSDLRKNARPTAISCVIMEISLACWQHATQPNPPLPEGRPSPLRYVS